MYNMSNNKLSDQLTITQSKLGNGAFGCVYVANSDGKDIAIKCESKKSQVLTLLREFKICRKIYLIKKYVKYINYFNSTKDLEEQNKIKEILKNMELNPTIKVYKFSRI